MERRSLLLLLLVLPVAFWPGSTSYDAPKLTLWALVCGLWALDLGHRFGTGRTGPVTRRQVLVPTGLTTVLGVGFLVPATESGPALRSALLICFWAATVMVVRRVAAHPVWRARLLAALTASGTAAGLYGLAQIAGWLPGAPITSGMPVGISTLGNQNYLAGLAALLLWPSVAQWWHPGQAWRALAMTGTLILAATVTFCGATGPQLGVASVGLLVVAAVVMDRLGRPENLPAVWLSMLLAGSTAVVVVFFTILAPESHNQTLESSPNPVQTTFTANHGDIRRADWVIALEMFRGRPLTGVGLGGYTTEWIPVRARLAAAGRDDTIPGSIPPSHWAHNEYLHLLAETGLSGVALVTGLAGWGLVGWKRRFRELADRPSRREFVLISCGLAVGAVHALVSFPCHLPASALTLAVLTGMLGSRPTPAPATTGPSQPLPGVLLVLAGLLLVTGAVREFHGDLDLARGRALYKLGAMPTAEQALTRGLHGTFWPTQGHLYRGLAWLAMGRTDAAADDLASSLRREPTFEAMNALAELRIEQGDLMAADALTSQVLLCRPYPQYRLQARFLQGLSRLRARNYPEAGTLLTELLQDQPDNHRAHLALGYLAALQGRAELARQHYRLALELVDQALAGETTPGPRLMLQQHRQTAVKAVRSLD